MFYILIITFTHGGCNRKILRTRPLPLTLCTPTSTSVSNCLDVHVKDHYRWGGLELDSIQYDTVCTFPVASWGVSWRILEVNQVHIFALSLQLTFVMCKRAFISKTHQIHFVVAVCHFLPTSAPCSLMQSLLKSTPGVTLGCCWDASLWCVC